MAFNGSGTYNLPAGNPVVTGTTISSSTTNTTNSDIATALTNCITRDGQSTPSANLPMNAKKLTGLAAGTSAGDSVRYEQTAIINESTGANSNIKSLSGLTTALSAAQGGTGLAGGGSTAGLVLTADGAGGFALSSSSPSVARSAKTSAYTIVAGDKGTLIEVTSGTFTLSLTAAATLGSGWCCYVSNIGSGLITIDPNSTETITVNGEALSTWVQWTNEIGILQCDGTGFHYYQIQKGTITQTVSSAVASIVFSGGLAYRKNMLLSWDNGNLTAADQIRLKLNTSVAPANSYGFLNSAGSLSAVSGANDNFTLGTQVGAGYSATARFNGQAMFTLSNDAVVAVINSKYFLSPNLSGGQTTSLFSSINRTTITDITIIPNSQTIASGTFTLTEL